MGSRLVYCNLYCFILLRRPPGKCRLGSTESSINDQESSINDVDPNSQASVTRQP
jgi:hypothetical protein